MLKQLKNKLVVFWSILRAGVLANSAIKLILWTTFIGATVFFVNRWSSPTEPTHYQEQMKAWKARAEITELWNDSLRTQNKTLTHFVDSVDVQVKVRDGKIATLSDKVVTLRKKNDSTLASLQFSLPDTCKAALVLAESFKAESDSNKKLFDMEKLNSDGLKLSKDSLQTQNKKLLVQNDSLVKIIKDVPVYEEPKFLHFIPLPSRKASFVIGGVLGVVTTVVTIIAVGK